MYNNNQVNRPKKKQSKTGFFIIAYILDPVQFLFVEKVVEAR
jgi:hypothetical protein